jgi:hypothetical protein
MHAQQPGDVKKVEIRDDGGISNTEALEQEGNKGFWYTQGATAVDSVTATATATSAVAAKEDTAEATAAHNENARWFEAAMDKFEERCKAEVSAVCVCVCVLFSFYVCDSV